MTQVMRIKVDKKVCSGCLSCVTTCSMEHESFASLSAGRVQVELSPMGGLHNIHICRQCANHPCLEACPVGAISRNEDDVVVIDQELCVDCLACIDACPFGAIFWSPVTEQVIKCDLCGGDPQCVEVCPTDALTIRYLEKKA